MCSSGKNQCKELRKNKMATARICRAFQPFVGLSCISALARDSFQ